MNMTCAYYRAHVDNSLWALRLLEGRIIDAVGPLSPAELQSPPMDRRSAIKINVMGWDVGAFARVSDEYTVVKATPLAGESVPRSPRSEYFDTGINFGSRLTKY